jgi:amidase
MADDALAGDDMCGLMDRLGRGEVSGEELRAAAVDRLHRVNPDLNAVASEMDGPPSDVEVPADAPLAGIPTAIKDNEAVAGYPTFHGSAGMPDAPAPVTWPWAAQFVAMGVSPVATTTLPEFGLTAATESTRFGVTRNPWDLGRTPGGSSGGSAALVASGVVPIAHANDGGGSIRIPAACCGLVGLKPTRGRAVDRPVVQRLPVPIRVQGILTRSVRDTARYFFEAEKLYANPSLPPIGDVRGPGAQRLRIGVLTRGWRGLPVSDQLVSLTNQTAEICAGLGHETIELEHPISDRFGPDFLNYWALIALMYRLLGRQVLHPDFDAAQMDAIGVTLSSMAARNALELPFSLRRLRAMAASHDEGFGDVDVVLSPTLSHEPPPVGYLGPDVDPFTHIVRLIRWITFTPLQNVSGRPAISLPLGRTQTDLPLAVQLAGGFGQERQLLELSYELEAAVGWPQGVNAA